MTDIRPSSHDKEPNAASTLADFKDAIETVVRELCQKLDGTEIPQNIRRNLIWREDRWQPSEAEAEPTADIGAMVATAYREFEEIPSVDQVVRLLAENDGIARRVFTEWEPGLFQDARMARYRVWVRLIQPVLMRYFSETRSFRFELETLRQTSGNLVAELQHPEITYSCITPLSGVRLALPEVRFAADLRLRPIRPGEMEKWASSQLGWGMTIPVFTLSGLQCGIELTYRVSAGAPAGLTIDQEERVRSVLTAVRLLADSKAYAAFSEMRTESILWGNVTLGSWKPSLLLSESPVEIGSGVEDGLVRLWRNFQASPNAERTRIALRRWDNAMERIRPEDELIDTCIALESLFMKQNEGAEGITFKLCLRAAGFLGESPDERVALFGNLTASYRRRSEVAHGRPPRGDLSAVASQTRSYVRRALLSILEQTRPFDPGDVEIALLQADISRREGTPDPV